METIRLFIILLLVGIILPPYSFGDDEYSPAIFWAEEGRVEFWQRDVVHMNQGYCLAHFVFNGSALKGGIQNLTVFASLVDTTNKVIFDGKIEVRGNLGGSGAERTIPAQFHGPDTWVGQDDGELSPVCDDSVTLVVNKAIGKQNNRLVELVANRQLQYVDAKKIKVKVK